MDLNGPQFSSLFQGATRWHTFIALAIIPIYFGQSALALGGLSAAAMTPLLNIVNVWVISVHGSGVKLNARAMALSILKNPFVLSSVGRRGLAVAASAHARHGGSGSRHDRQGGVGPGASGGGGGLRIDEALSTKGPVLLATFLKLLVMPVFMAVWLWILGVSGEAAAVAILCGAVPTGSGAYVLAKQMGGDAPMIASILTLQVICAAVTIPFVLSLLG